MIVTEHCGPLPPAIRRGTLGRDGLVYWGRTVVTGAKGGFTIRHVWLPVDEYLHRQTHLRACGVSSRTLRDTGGFERIQHRARSAANSLRRVDRRPLWYALEWLGCPLAVFRERFSRMFKPGMSWHALDTWHMDHIIPVSVFDWSDPLSAYVCGHYANYQPLCPVDNSRKHMFVDEEALERVAIHLPTKLLPVVRTIATHLEKTPRSPLLCPAVLETRGRDVLPTISVMYSIRPISSEDRDLLISPPPCPMYSEPHDFCSSLG